MENLINLLLEYTQLLVIIKLNEENIDIWTHLLQNFSSTQETLTSNGQKWPKLLGQKFINSSNICHREPF